MSCRALLSVALVLFASIAGAANPQVRLHTDLGDIVLELYPEQAPATVANFLTYVNDGFYDGTIFHRVIPGFMVQGGGMTFDFVKKATREPVINESANGLLNETGTVAMARLLDPDSAQAQFFINLDNNKHLNPSRKQPGYTVFGRVLSGMDVVESITREKRGMYRAYRDAPNMPVRILSARLEATTATPVTTP
jgi:cyclophilin family peptidyl-prolyl cis-trans isomerase